MKNTYQPINIDLLCTEINAKKCIMQMLQLHQGQKYLEIYNTKIFYLDIL